MLFVSVHNNHAGIHYVGKDSLLGFLKHHGISDSNARQIKYELFGSVKDD